ncbi:B-cell linker protein [Dissostichus eleginoides]|uniref:B-cell linker protein n=1 Tax=Dissostichus eleginoides TaxID=100907 RepID=A0AAD9C1W7_DISEL|nr:B-cell linker protein [Dissostichus eleginoides]
MLVLYSIHNPPLFISLTMFSAPEVDRNDKPGRKNKGPPPDPIDEDVYLDPNEEQDDNEELYLEPTAARGPMRMPPSPMTALMPSPIPMRKPPVPRAHSNPLLPSSNDSIEARRGTFPTKLPLPPTSVKPPLLAHLKEGKPSLLNALMPDTKPVVSSGGMRASKQSGNEDKEWFAGDCNRKKAEELLLRVNKDGAFLIRHSSAQSSRQPYTLAVLYQQKVYNVPIRFMGETQGYALGKEGKKNEEIFNSLDEMISHHKNNQLLLIDSKSQAKQTTYLTHAERP